MNPTMNSMAGQPICHTTKKGRTMPAMCIQGYQGDRYPGSYSTILLSRITTTARHTNAKTTS